MTARSHLSVPGSPAFVPQDPYTESISQGGVLGAIIFSPGSLADGLSETAGYKAGLALSVEELCDHLSGTEYPDIIRESEDGNVRVRVEEYDAMFYKLLHRIGYTKEEFDGDATGAGLHHKYRNTGLHDAFLGVTTLFVEMWPKLIDQATSVGSRTIDPTPFIMASLDKYGGEGGKLALERLEVLDRGMSLNPHSTFRAVDWDEPLALNRLFSGTSKGAPAGGKFIDQRFVNYLSNNPDRLPQMHWRKFEELTAEFFYREGFEVKLGPGSNDDGVDVRVWKQGAAPTEAPLCLVQCKRQKEKIGRVIVKGLYADVTHEGAEYGVVVTTSELSPAAKSTISARGYPIRQVEREGVNKWLEVLRTPGTGIVRF
jgi:restriction system protein